MQTIIQSHELFQYIFAGNARFTLHNPITNNHHTYIIRKKKDRDIFFVKVLTGSDNTKDYSYIGFIRNGVFKWGYKGGVNRSARSVKVFEWFMNNYNDLRGIEVYNEGTCCRCGRLLTVPSSVNCLIGPECAKQIGH